MKNADDDAVKLKLTCGAVMNKENLYFDMFDLYVDCSETSVEGCDLLTKPKTECLRSMHVDVDWRWRRRDSLRAILFDRVFWQRRRRRRSEDLV